jgi:hypothetical protein
MDISVGNNCFDGITGFSVGAGWDPASGLRTPDAVSLADALTHTIP